MSKKTAVWNWNGVATDDEIERMFSLARRQSALEERWKQREETIRWWNGGAPKEITQRIRILWRILVIVEENKRAMSWWPGTYYVKGRCIKVK